MTRSESRLRGRLQGRYRVAARMGMIFGTTGKVSEGLYVTGLAWAPSVLFTGAGPVLFDAGFHCAGKLYERDIRRVIGSASPEILFLSHVHWDHCGAAAYLKGLYPSMKIAGSARAASTMKRERAVELMAKLNEEVVPLVKELDGVDRSLILGDSFRAFEIDMVLDDGGEISLKNGTTVRVMASPGHTLDLLSYYIPEEGILVGTEACGLLWHNGDIGTEFLVDFDDYMTSLKRLAALDVRILCQGHHFVFVGKDEVKRFFARSMEAAERFKDDVEEWLRLEDGSVDRAAMLMKAKEYDTNTGLRQPEESYLINLRIKVAHLAKRMERRAEAGNGGSLQGNIGPN